MRFELLVFDWDGTLMDSVASIVACSQAAGADIGLELAEPRVRSALGLSLSEMASRFGVGNDPARVERFVERYRHHWFDRFREQVRLFDGVEAAVRALAEAGYLLAVATGKSRRGLDRDLEATGLKTHFLATRTVDEAPAKPNPQMLFDLFAELGVNARGAAMIGDTTHDLEMARQAGSAGIGVASGSHGREDLLAAGPLCCLDSVTDLPEWLARGEAS